MGLAVADLAASAHLVQGILACLVRRGVTQEGGRVEVSLLESILDLQFEVITTHLNDGFKEPQRSSVKNAHAYLGAPYGIYATADGHLALAMGSIVVLGELLDCPALLVYQDRQSWFDRRDEIKGILRDHLSTRSTAHWLSILEPADIWCADVLSWSRLRQTEGYKSLDMEQEILCPGGTPLQTLRCPIHIDGAVSKSPVGAPAIGQHTASIDAEFSL
jgi:crotonobetainyl-CoA:carnitine CoA-transferase CaiB-like acyl-CoA transferase